MDPIETQEEIVTVREEKPQKVIRKTKHVEPLNPTEHPQKVFDQKKKIFRFHQVVWYILAVVEILLSFRAVFKMIGANPFSAFVAFIYGITEPLAFPFRGIIASSQSGSSVYEWYLIFAAIIYLLLASAIIYLAQFVKPLTPREVEQNI